MAAPRETQDVVPFRIEGGITAGQLTGGVASPQQVMAMEAAALSFNLSDAATAISDLAYSRSEGIPEDVGFFLAGLLPIAQIPIIEGDSYSARQQAAALENLRSVVGQYSE